MITERSLQTALMWEMLHNRNHEIVIPNTTTFFPWEADLISVTRSGYSHEFEIKISLADFNRDRKKKRKHDDLAHANPSQRLPNYFWYVVPEGMNVQVPGYAGLIVCHRQGIDEIVSAPLLHREKVDPKRKEFLAHLLGFRLMTEMVSSTNKEK